MKIGLIAISNLKNFISSEEKKRIQDHNFNEVIALCFVVFPVHYLRAEHLDYSVPNIKFYCTITYSII